MKNCPAHRRRRKKKIARLVEEALREAEEFAAAYAPPERKRVVAPAPQNTMAPEYRPAPQYEVEIHEAGSEKFAEAVRKISPELLELLRDQFNARPEALLCGVPEERTSAAHMPGHADIPASEDELILAQQELEDSED